MKVPRILFLLSGRDVPATRYRILPYLPYLKEAGFRCHLAFSFPQKYQGIRWIGWRASQFLKRLRFTWALLVAFFRRYDIVYIEREILDAPNWSFEKKFRWLVPLMVLDVDDAIFLRYPDKFAAIAGMSDLIVAGNTNLVNKSLVYQNNVVLLPTSVELNDYSDNKVAHSADSQQLPIVGWIGTESNLDNLAAIIPALNSLYENEPFLLRIVTGSHVDRSLFENCEFRTEFRMWNASNVSREIAGFTIGVMPLKDEEWQRYKCGFKLLQYMAAGVPAIASPVGVNAEIIDHGQNGLLAENLNDWTEMLTKLIRDDALRLRLSRSASDAIKKNYSISGNAPRLIQSLIDLLENDVLPQRSS